MASRFASDVTFDGPVRKGAKYILVDDFVTSGSTLADLRNYIEHYGGEVVAGISLANASSAQNGYSGDLAIKPETALALQQKFGEESLREFLNSYGINGGRVGALTNPEGRWLLSFGSLDAAGNRIAQARRDRNARMGNEVLRETEVRRAPDVPRYRTQVASPEQRRRTRQRAVDWMRIYRAVAPGAAASLDLRIADRYEAARQMAEAEARATGRAAAYTIPEDAYAAIHRDSIYLFREGLREFREAGNELSEGVRLVQHELGHGWWDTLPVSTREALARLWKAETGTKSGVLYDDAGNLRGDVYDGIEEDIQEWFAERVSLANDAWAQKRADIANHDGTMIGKAAAGLRSWLFDAMQTLNPNLSRDVLADEFRKVLRRGFEQATPEPRAVTPDDDEQRFATGGVPFSKIVEDVRQRRIPRNTPINLGRTPDVFRKAGAPDAPLAISSSVIEKAAEKHSLPYAILNNLPADLRARVMIVRNPSETGVADVIAILATVYDGRPLVAAVQFNSQFKRHVVNEVRTVHAKDRFEQNLQRWLADGKVLHFSKKEGPAWLREFAPRQLREMMSQLDLVQDLTQRDTDQPNFAKKPPTSGGRTPEEITEPDREQSQRARPVGEGPVRQFRNATVAGPMRFAIKAWHGTPHEVERFSTGRIGTGEGIQVYGWGLYFAEDRSVAEYYRDALARERDGGMLYQVELDVEPDELLDWDAPLFDQSDYVQRALAATDWYPYAEERLESRSGAENPTGAALYSDLEEDATPQEVSEMLLAAGIRGIRYLDGVSRDALAGTRNYVMFDDTTIRITGVNGFAVSESKRAELLGTEEAPQFARAKPKAGSAFGNIINGPIVRPLAYFEKQPGFVAVPKFDFSRTYKGTADVLEQDPKLRPLAQAIRKHVDRARHYISKLAFPYRRWEQRWKGKQRKQAMKEFEAYWSEDSRNPLLSAKVYRQASDAGKELIDLWKQTAAETNAINQQNKLAVYDGQTGRWRRIGSVKDYFPRSMRQDVQEVLTNATVNPSLYTKVVNAMKAEGLIHDPAEADRYIKNALSQNKSFDYLGHIEAARNIRLPNMVYDYSFEAARRYMTAWSERMAQIEAFGQKAGAGGKDLFDRVLDDTIHPGTQRYIREVQNRAYNVMPDNGTMKAAIMANTSVTGAHLGNPVTAALNLVSGATFSTQHLGIRNSLRALWQLRSIKRTFDAIDDAYERGVLLDDMMSMMHDASAFQDKAGGESVVQKTARFNTSLLKWGGFTGAEELVRAHNLMAAKAWLRQALKANQRNPRSNRSLINRAFISKLRISPGKLFAENGTGETTDRFLRAAVNEIQGGYRYDQLPAFVDSPVGRFLLKYQKWSFQQYRHFIRNVVEPLAKPGYVLIRNDKTGEMEKVKVPRQYAPAMRYLALTALAGAALAGFKDWLVGRPDDTASWAEIFRKADDDTIGALQMALSKIGAYMIGVGAFGALGNYGQIFWDFAERRRFKNPMNPPGLAFAEAAGEQAMRFFEKGGTLSTRDLNDFAEDVSSQYRVVKQAGSRGLDVLGIRFRGQLEEMRRQDLRWLATKTRQFERETGIFRPRTSFGRIGKSPKSDLYDALQTDLLLGDAESARNRIRKYLRRFDDPAQAMKEFESIRASVRSRQPIRVGGYAGNDRRYLFYAWAKEYLSPEELERVLSIDRAYLDTAIGLGLMKPPEKPDERQLSEAMMRFRMKPGGG